MPRMWEFTKKKKMRLQSRPFFLSRCSMILVAHKRRETGGLTLYRPASTELFVNMQLLKQSGAVLKEGARHPSSTWRGKVVTESKKRAPFSADDGGQTETSVRVRMHFSVFLNGSVKWQE